MMAVPGVAIADALIALLAIGSLTPTARAPRALRFSAPVFLGSGVNLTLNSGENITLHANETNTGFFYAFDDQHLFGQYNEAEFPLSSVDPFVQSSDGGRSWRSAGAALNCNLNQAPYKSACTQNVLVPAPRQADATGPRRFFSLSGNGPFWSGPSVSGHPPWTKFASSWRATYSLAADGHSLNTSLLDEPVVFQGMPADRAIWPRCFPNGLDKSLFTYASAELEGSAIIAALVCDSPNTTQTWGTNLSAPSLVAFASEPGTDGRVWTYQGVIADARTMVPKDTVRGLTAEVDLAVLADGKTLLAVMRPDGDCTCAMARLGPEQQPECGIYRYYYQALSSDGGRSWTPPAPMRGVGKSSSVEYGTTHALSSC
jgi:hypothetical protein